MIIKYCIYQYNNFRNFNPKQKTRQIVIDLGAALQRIPAEDEELYEILKAKAYCVEWEEPQHRRNVVPSYRHFRNLEWAHAVFAKHEMLRQIVWTSERLLKDESISRNEKKSLIAEAITAAKLTKMEEKVTYFEALEKKMEKEREDLDSKKIVFMNNFIIDQNPPYTAYILFNKELRKLLFEDIKKTNKDLLVEFTEFNLQNLKNLVENSKGCRLCVIDAPIYAQEPNSYKSEFTFESRSDSVLESSMSHSTLKTKTETAGQIDVLIVLGHIYDPEAKKILERVQASFLVSLNFGGIVNNPLDLFNIVMATEFKYTFAQKLVKMLIMGTKVETALEQIGQVTFDELRRTFKKHNMQSITNVTNKEPIEMDPDDFFRDCIQVQPKPPHSKLRFDFKQGTVEEIPSVFSTHQFNNRMTEAIQRTDTIKKIMDGLHKSQVVNIYGKKGIGKTVIVKMLYDQCTALQMFKDGVHIFDLKGFAEENPNGNIKELMRSKLGDSFDEDMDTYFKSREMLIIFDDFHIITSKNMLIFPIHLLKMLMKHNIRVLLTSDTKLKREDDITKTKMTWIRLNRLSQEESLMLFLSSQKHLLVKLDGASLEHALNSEINRNCKGYPKLIVQNAHKFTSKVLGIMPIDLDRSVNFSSDPEDGRESRSDSRKKNQIKAHSEFNAIEESPGNILAPLPGQGHEFGKFPKSKPEPRKTGRRKQVPWKREPRNDNFKFD